MPPSVSSRPESSSATALPANSPSPTVADGQLAAFDSNCRSARHSRCSTSHCFEGEEIDRRTVRGPDQQAGDHPGRTADRRCRATRWVCCGAPRCGAGSRRSTCTPRRRCSSTIAAGQIRDLEGQTTNALSSSDIAFHTLREYVRGDDLRHVHWKSSAKIGELMVRQYNDTRRSHIAVLLSTDPDEFESDDEFELGISCAASVAVQALRDEQTLTVIAGGTQFPAINPTRLLDHFSGIEGVPGHGGIEDALKLARRIAADASVAVLCIGSRLDVPEIRRATSRAALEMNSVVLRVGARQPSPATGPSVPAGSSTCPNLDALNRGLSAVAA